MSSFGSIFKLDNKKKYSYKECREELVTILTPLQDEI
jgi:hypothetical protein